MHIIMHSKIQKYAKYHLLRNKKAKHLKIYCEKKYNWNISTIPLLTNVYLNSKLNENENVILILQRLPIWSYKMWFYIFKLEISVISVFQNRQHTRIVSWMIRTIFKHNSENSLSVLIFLNESITLLIINSIFSNIAVLDCNL